MIVKKNYLKPSKPNSRLFLRSAIRSILICLLLTIRCSSSLIKVPVKHCHFCFSGELGKLEMVHEGIMHKCIKQLIERKKTPGGATARVADMSEDMECLCEIMRTVGRRLDHERARAWMDKYFERIRAYQADEELPSRIRFMLQDVIELRANRWQPRKLVLARGAPKTIQQVRRLFICVVISMSVAVFGELKKMNPFYSLILLT